MCTHFLNGGPEDGQGKERKREREGGGRESAMKRLSLRKHGVSLSSHMWSRLTGRPDALMEINQSDITAPFATASTLSSISPRFSLGLHPLKGTLPLRIETWPLFPPPLPASLALPLTSSLAPYPLVSSVIINATPLIRSFSPALSRPLTPASFTRGVRIKGGK